MRPFKIILVYFLPAMFCTMFSWVSFGEDKAFESASRTTARVVELDRDHRRSRGTFSTLTVEFTANDHRVEATFNVNIGFSVPASGLVEVEYLADNPEQARLADNHIHRSFGWVFAIGAGALGAVGTLLLGKSWVTSAPWTSEHPT
jgi:hypothetical protein